MELIEVDIDDTKKPMFLEWQALGAEIRVEKGNHHFLAPRTELQVKGADRTKQYVVEYHVENKDTGKKSAKVLVKKRERVSNFLVSLGRGASYIECERKIFYLSYTYKKCTIFRELPGPVSFAHVKVGTRNVKKEAYIYLGTKSNYVPIVEVFEVDESGEKLLVSTTILDIAEFKTVPTFSTNIQKWRKENDEASGKVAVSWEKRRNVATEPPAKRSRRQDDSEDEKDREESKAGDMDQHRPDIRDMDNLADEPVDVEVPKRNDDEEQEYHYDNFDYVAENSLDVEMRPPSSLRMQNDLENNVENVEPRPQTIDEVSQPEEKIANDNAEIRRLLEKCEQMEKDNLALKKQMEDAEKKEKERKDEMDAEHLRIKKERAFFKNRCDNYERIVRDERIMRDSQWDRFNNLLDEAEAKIERLENERNV